MSCSGKFNYVCQSVISTVCDTNHILNRVRLTFTDEPIIGSLLRITSGPSSSRNQRQLQTASPRQ
jgi:hypothetical protein